MTVSVVIPTYNARPLLVQNVPLVLSQLRVDDELIIVDDASPDTSVAWLRKTYGLQVEACDVKDADCYSGIVHGVVVKVLVNHDNVRFATACNRGVLSAKGDIIVLLNNDVVPHDGFLSPLLPHFEDPKVFAVGCQEIATHEGNRLYGRAGAQFARGFLVHWREEDQEGSDTAWVAGGSGAFRRSMWRELGGFDPIYRPAYWEDIDLSYRGRKRGWKIVFEPQSKVDHNHETTHSTVFGKEQMEVMAFKNSVLFVWKNATLLQLLSHIFWLPYHLLITNRKTQGRFLRGYLAAIQAYFF